MTVGKVCVSASIKVELLLVVLCSKAALTPSRAWRIWEVCWVMA